MQPFQCDLQPQLQETNRTTHTGTTTCCRTQRRNQRTAAATAAHTRYLSSPAAATLHGKTQGFLLRLPPHNTEHATFMQPFQCDLQPQLQETNRTTHTGTTTCCRTQRRNQRTAAATAAHTRYLSSPAAATLHGKTQGFLLRLPPHNTEHATFMQPFQCDLQPQLQETNRTTHTGTTTCCRTQRRNQRTAAATAAHTRHLSSPAAATLHGKMQGFVLRLPPQNKAHATFMRSATTDSKHPINTHTHKHSQSSLKPPLQCSKKEGKPTAAATAAHRRYLSSPAAATLHGKTQGFLLRLPPHNTERATFMQPFQCDLQPQLQETNRTTHTGTTTCCRTQRRNQTTAAATAAHRRYPSSPAAATLHGKMQGFVLRLPPQNKAHATFMQPFQCDLQPQLQETNRTTHTGTTTCCRTQRRNQRTTAATAAHTRHLSSPAAATLHGKMQGFLLRLPPHNTEHATFMQPFQCDLQPQLQETHRTTHTGTTTCCRTQRRNQTTAAATAAHMRYLSSPAAATLHGKMQGFVLRLPPQNKAHATFMQPFQCDLQPQLQETNRTTHTGTTTCCRTQRRNQRTAAATAAHTRHLSSPAAATLHGKMQGFVLRLPPQNKAHATFMRSATTDSKTPYKYAHTHKHSQSSLKPPLQCGKKRRQTDRSRNRRTQEVPFIAGCSHFTRKNTRFPALASSPKQSPCNIHAAITMRFAASRSKPASLHTWQRQMTTIMQVNSFVMYCYAM